MILRMVSVFLAILLLQVSDGAAKEIGPGMDWCGAIDALASSEELVLRPGEYQGPCSIRRGGTETAPLVIRAKDPQQPPQIAYLGQSDNVLSIEADHVAVRGLQFGPTLSGVDAIRIYRGDNITIEDCRFFEIGGIAVAATHASVRKITVRRNEIRGTGWTAIYLGCHDGFKCKHSELLIEQNYIHGVEAAEDDPGAGMQVKLNSTGTIRDNVIVNTRGPGIMIYGAQELGSVSIVERNFVAGSRTSSAILIGGGPAVVRNNVTIGSAQGGIGLENYGRRGLLRGIVIMHNTVYRSDEGGILVPGQGRVEAIIVNNAVHAPPGRPAFPRGRIGILSLGNVDCTWLPCFMDPDQRDFSPLAIGPATLPGEEWTPPDDYFGRRRGPVPTVGAIEQLAGPIPLGIKSMRPEGHR